MKAIHEESNRRLENLRVQCEVKREECISMKDAWQQESIALEGQLQGLVQAASGITLYS